MSAQYDGSVIINTVLDITGVKKGTEQITSFLRGSRQGVIGLEKDFQNLGSTVKKVGALIGSAFAISKITSFAKEAIDLGSDLAEVQNVVDSVFTTMSGKVDDFARSAQTMYGLSETMAKQFTGTYGAMAKAFGFAEEEAYNMATTLTGLAGDVASFYNLDQDVAYTKLKSVFSGETESLKDLGIVMTQTALDQYALQKGLGISTAKMTEQQKVALRYQFILDQLATASGDFAKTSDSWANQTRILKLQVDSLKASLGTGLINLFTPALKMINLLLSKLATLANAFRSFTELITGAKAEGGGASGLGSAAETFGEAADGAQELAGATDKVTKATKKADRAQKDYLSGLDDIHKYAKGQTTADMSAPAASSGGTGLNPAVAAVDYGQLAQGTTVVDKLGESFNRLAETIRREDWDGLGRYMAEGINSGLEKIYTAIDWNTVGPKITKSVDAFTRTFNSLMDNLDWDLAGRTIGSGINTISNSIRLGIEGINWKNLGSKLATGVNGIVRKVDWNGLGSTIGSKFKAAWDTFGGYVLTLDYQGIGISVASLLNGAFRKMKFSTVASYLTTGINGAFNTLKSFTETFEWDEARENIQEGINTAIRTLKWKDAGKTLEDFWTKIDEFLLGLDVDWEGLGKGIGDFISEIDWGKHLKNGLKVAKTVLEGIWKGLGDTAAGNFIQGLILFNIGLKLLPFINNISTAMTGTTATAKISDAAGTLLSTAFKTGITSAISVIEPIITSAIGGTLTAIAAATGIAYEMSKIADRNGVLTEFGAVFNAFTQQLKNTHVVSDETIKKLEEVVDAYETGTYDAETATQKYQEVLTQAGVSAELAQAIFNGTDFTAATESYGGLSQVVEGLGDAVHTSAMQFDTNKITYNEACDFIEQALRELGTEAGYEDNIMKGLADAFRQNLPEGVTDANAALDSAIEMLSQSGYSADDLFTLLSQKAPESFGLVASTATEKSQWMADNMKEYFGKAKESMGELTNSAREQVTQNWESMRSSTASASKGIADDTAERFKEVSKMSDEEWKNVKGFLSTSQSDMVYETNEKMKSVYTYMNTWNKSIYDRSRQAWENIAKSASSAMGDMARTCESAAYRIADAFGDAFSGITSPMNTFIRKLNSLISGAQNAQNTIADLLSFDIHISSAVARFVGWDHAWLRVPAISSGYRVPYLASGAVIPPNAPFTAVLGDQKRGNNIEAPEDLIRKIVREESGSSKGGSYQFTAQINRRTIFDQVIEEAKLRQQETDRNPFDLL